MKINNKYKPLWTGDWDYAVVTGGRGSGKSFSVGVFAENLTFEVGQVILYSRYTMTSAQTSVIPEFKEKIELEGHDGTFTVNKNDVKNNITGSSVMFRGLKTSSGLQTAALKSINGLSCWVLDEAEELTDESEFDKIDNSIRSKVVKNRVILMMNPATKEHWVYKRFFEKAGTPEGFNGIKDRVLYIHTSYLDNKENLSDKFLRAAERIKTTNTAKYNHIMMGGWLNKAEGVIFNNWSIGEFDNKLPYVYGCDFGSIDPDTLVKVAVDDKLKKIYVDELMYTNNQSTDELIANIVQLSDGLVIADSAEPRLIGDIRKSNVNIKAVKKTTIISGIKLIQGYELIITPNSTNLAMELNNYCWSNKKGEIPIDAYNHLIDATRYALTVLIKKSAGNYVLKW